MQINTTPGQMHPFLCMQCDDELVALHKPHLYCSIACEQEAELVRYVRRCKSDNRIEQEDVQLAVRTRLAHLASGGYDKKARRLSKQQKEEVITESNGLCTFCGKPGVEIDHVEGPSASRSNLQLLCRTCHEEKTFASIVSVAPGSDSWAQVKALNERFWTAVDSVQPSRECHDEKAWALSWRDHLKKRKSFVLPSKSHTIPAKAPKRKEEK